ncbi:protein of unknown function [Methylococcus capsulatus]|uniref:Uncharacterized protein n=1 Tax=Methylococcus capsulatus TaxID=414 RepID=A0AA35UFP6_METCP|nr:protein of unknown function [Methylococcus capsulatus]
MRERFHHGKIISALHLKLMLLLKVAIVPIGISPAAGLTARLVFGESPKESLNERPGASPEIHRRAHAATRGRKRRKAAVPAGIRYANQKPKVWMLDP